MAKYNINLGFSIDTNQLDKAMRDITKRINELNKTGTLEGVSVKDKTKELSELLKLQDAIQKAQAQRGYGVGGKDITDPGVVKAINEELRRSVISYNQQTYAVDRNSVMSQRAAAQQAKMAEQMKKTREQADPLQKAINKLTGSFQAIAMFSLAQFGFRGLTGTVTDAIEYVKQLDKSMTNIRIVTGATTAELKQFAMEYNKLGQEMGRTTAEVADAFGTFYRQGLEGAQAADMVRATIVGATVAGESLVEVSDKLTSVINGFQLASTEAMSVMDKFATLDAAMATSFKEMSYAMTKIASSAHNANMSLDETLALVATISEVTREAPENIGTALKTMVARMRGITDEGFVTDETIQDMNKVDKALRTIGISQKDARGEMRNTYEVLDELGQRWNTLTSSQQSYIATAVAGSRQTTRFYAMIENWDKVMEAHDLSLNSSGRALQQFEEAQNSIEYQMKQTRAALEELYAILISSNNIIAANKNWQILVETMIKGLKIINPMTIAILALNRGVASLAKHKLANLDLSKLWSTLKVIRHPIQSLKTELDKFKNIFAVDRTGLKEADRLLKSMTLSQKQYNLLTAEQKTKYNEIQQLLQTNKLHIQEAVNNEKERKRIMEEFGRGFIVESHARQQLLAIARDLRYSDLESLATAREINKELKNRINSDREHARNKMKWNQEENLKAVQQMRVHTAIKNIMGETVALIGSMVMITSNYDTAIKRASDRWEATNARIQKNIQTTAAMTQYTQQVITSGTGIVTGGMQARAQGLYTAAGLAGNASQRRDLTQQATRFTMMAAGIDAATTAITSISMVWQNFNAVRKQMTFNKEKEEYDKLNKTMSEHADKLNSIVEMKKEILTMGTLMDTLQKGISDTGKNLGLTNEEFAQYNDFTEKIAELMPEMIKGYTKEGKAILDNSLKMQDYIDLLEKKRIEEQKNIEGIRPSYTSQQAKDIAYERTSYEALYAQGKEKKAGFGVTDWGKIGLGIGEAILGGVIIAASGAVTALSAGTLTAPAAIAASTGLGLITTGVATSSSGLGATEKIVDIDKRKLEEEARKNYEATQKIYEKRAEAGIKQKAAETLKTSAEISKAMTETYQELDEQEQKTVDLILDRLDFSAIYLEQSKKRQGDIDKAYAEKNEEKRQKALEEIDKEIMKNVDMMQTQAVEIAAKHPAELKIAFREEAELNRDLEKGKISMQEYANSYNAIKQSIIDMLKAGGMVFADAAEEVAILEGLGFSSFGENLLDLQKKLEGYTDAQGNVIKGLNIEISKLGPLSLEAVKGINAFITAYAILNDELNEDQLEAWRIELNNVIKSTPKLADQLGKITKAQEESNWKLVEEEIRNYNNIVMSLTGNTNLLIDALSQMHIQIEIDPNRAKQLYASAVNELKNVSQAVSDVNDIFSKVDEVGRISMDNLLEIAGKRSEIWDYVTKDAEGLLTLDASGIKNLMVDAYEESAAAIREMKGRLDREKESTISISILGQLGVQLMDEKESTFDDINDFYDELDTLLDPKNKARREQFADSLKVDDDTLQQMIKNKGAFVDALTPIITEDTIDDAISTLKTTTDEATESVKALDAELKMLENVDITVKITEQLVMLRDDLDDATWSLKENKWAIEDANRELAELPNVLAKAERAWGKAQKAWERAPRILEKAIKTYNKTMKKLIEDEAVLELEFKYNMNSFDIAPITNKIDLLKTSIELLGDADPSQSMKYYSEILSATVNKSALLNSEMERLMNTQAASGAEAKVLATEIDNVSKALMDNYKQGLEARNKISELSKKQQEEAINSRKTMLENESKNMDLLTKSIDESITKLQKGSWGRGLGGQLLIRSIFERPDKTEKDPVKVKQMQDKLIIEEHQKYLDKINELNKQAAKENYETAKIEFIDARIDAEWALNDAYEANADALIAYNDALKTYEEAQNKYQRDKEQIPHKIEELNKEGVKLETKIANLTTQITGLEQALDDIEIRESKNLITYLEALGYSGDTLEKVLGFWEEESKKSNEVKENMKLIATMTAEELTAFLASDETKSIADAFFKSITQLNEEKLSTQAEETIREINDAMLQAFKDGNYEAFTTKVNAVLNTGTLTPDLEKMYSDVSTKSDVFMNERKKKQEQLLDELVDYAGVTREAAEEALSDIKATLEDPTKEWTDTMKEVGKAIQKIFTDKPIVVPIDFELLDALANMPDYGFYTGTDKLQQYYSGTSKLQQYNTGTQGTPDEGVSMTGELGREVAILPNGQFKMLGENGPEMSYLPKGTIIYNHNDTEKILNYIRNPEQNKVQNYVSSNDIKNTQLQAYKDGTTSNFGPILSTYTKNWNNFNQKRTNKQGKTYYHQGNDLAAPTGTPIYAPMTGTVTYPFSTGRGLNSSAGYNVTLKLSNGYSMVAMHMNKPGVYDPGTQVPQGAIIGYVGNTGDSSGPHLHVELRSPNGNILNPSNYFSSYSGSVTGAPFVAQSSVSQLNAYLGGVFAGKGQTFENAAKKAGIDPYLLAAIAMHETGNGTSAAVRNKNNPGGIMSGPDGTLGNYSSLSSGIQAMADLLYRGYISQGLTTIEQIQKKYCPVGAKNDPLGLNKHWTSGVTKFYEMLSGQSYTGEFTSAGFNFQNLKYTLFDSVMSILSGDSKGSPLGDAATKAIRDRFGSLKTELSSLFGQRITDKNIASEAGVKPDQAFISNDASKLYKKNKDGSNTLLAMWDNAWKFATDETKTYGKTSTIGTYADGTDGTPRTEPAMVGEEGFEVAILPNGQMKLLGKNGPEVVKLPKGTVIYDHDTSTMIKNYIPSVENAPMKTYASGTTSKIPTYANGTKKLSEMDDTEYEKEIERIIQRLKDFGVATENVTKLMSEIREDIKKATKLRQQWNEEEKKYFELRQAAYARDEGAEFELGMTLTKSVHEMVNSLIDSLVEQYIPTDISGEELATFYEDERKRYMTMFKDDFKTFNRLVESINESASQELSIWDDINKKYINQYGQSLIDISAEAILQAEKTKLKIEKMHSDLYTMSKSTVITDIQKSYNAFAKSITSFYDALKAPDKIGFLSRETMRESWNKNITGLNNLSKLIGALGSEADSVITKMIANKRIVKTAELAYNEGKSFWGPDGFSSTMTDEQIQNIKDYAEYNNKIYRETFSKLGYTAEEAMKMGASINDSILSLFDELGGTTSNALKDMVSLANALNLHEAGASAQQINEAMEGASEHAKRYLKILTEAGTEAEKQAKLQKQMIDDLYKHSIKTQMALYEFKITSSEAEIKIEIQRLEKYKQEAMSIYEYLAAGGTPLEGQLDHLNQLIEAIEKSQDTISSLDDAIQQAMSAKFAIAYEQSFKRFNEELEKMNKQYERTIRLNESLKKGNNPLFNVKETKDILAYTTNKLSIIKEYIEGLKKAQLELAGTNKEAYDQIQKDIEAAEDEEFNLMIQQNELFFTMMEDSWTVVEKVLDRIQKRMDNLKFELGVKDTIADLEIALMEVDALRGIVDMSALYLTPDLDAAASYYREAINSSYDLLTANQKMLETRERLNNVQIDGFENIEDQKAAQKALNEEIQSTAFYYQKMAEEALKTTKQMKEQLNILKKEQAASKIAYDTLIKQKEDELAALQEAEKAEKEANNLLEAKLTLIKALDDVSYSYITGAGIEIMRPDVEKIDEAKAKVAELEREQAIQNLTDALQEEINALKEEADKKNQYYDAQINALTAMITAQEEMANRFQEEADNLRSDWLDIVTGIREDSLIQLEKSWSEHLNLIGDFKDGLDRWFSGDLTDKILIPITNDLEKASAAFETGIKTGEEIVKDFKNIINEDLSDAIQMFNNTVEDWAKTLGDIFGDGGSFHTNLSNWLSEYQNALNSAKYGFDSPGDKTGGGETSTGTTPIGKSEPKTETKTESKSETKTETEKPTDTSAPSTFPQLTTNYGDPYSIVDALKSVLYGERSNWPSNSIMWNSIGGQSELTSINGLTGVGTATTNAQLLNLLKQGQLKKVPGYKTGGLADFTGLAWLDGTEENPELVLNAQDTANFMQLTNLLRKLELEELWSGMVIEFDEQGIIQNALREIADILMKQSKDNKIYIDNINLPNVSNAGDFVNDLGQLVNSWRNQGQ